MDLDSVQIRLKLTSDPEILDVLRKKNMLTKDSKGNEIYSRQFDSQPFEFVPGQALTLGKSVADSLRLDSLVVIGDAATGPMRPALVEVGRYDAGKAVEEGIANKMSPTACGFCGEEFETPGKLGYHLMHAHKEEDDEEGKPEEPKSSEAGEEIEE